MSGCDYSINCLQEPHIPLYDQVSSKVIEEVCQNIDCYEKALILHHNASLCLLKECLTVTLCLLKECLTDEEYPPWARPLSCAGIVFVLIVFVIMVYFGRGWKDGRWNRDPERRTRAKVNLMEMPRSKADMMERTSLRQSYRHNSSRKSMYISQAERQKRFANSPAEKQKKLAKSRKTSQLAEGHVGGWRKASVGLERSMSVRPLTLNIPLAALSLKRQGTL